MIGEKITILRNVLGDYWQTGDEYLFYCKRCGHHKRKLSVNVEKNVFKCWVCGYRGDNVRYLIKKYGTQSQAEAWGEMFGETELSSWEDQIRHGMGEGFDEEEEEQVDIELPKEFISLCNKKLPLSTRAMKKYLKSRGLKKKDFLYWRIGCCLDGDYSGRVIFPSFDRYGTLNYFVSRKYDDDWNAYKNPDVPKNRIIFNELMLDFNSPITVVEGVFDAIVAGENSVPILGTTLDEETKLFENIVRYDTPVYLALDHDAEQKRYKQKKSKYDRVIEKLLAYDVDTYKIDTSGYKDVGVMTRQTFMRRKDRAIYLNADSGVLLDAIGKI